MQPRTRDQKIPDKIFIFSGVNFAIGFKYRLEFVSTPNLQAHSKFYLVEFEVSKEDCNPECVLYVIYFGNYWTWQFFSCYFYIGMGAIVWKNGKRDIYNIEYCIRKAGYSQGDINL